MKRRDKPDIASGVIIIDKHEGVTSHRIVQILRMTKNMKQFCSLV